MSAGFIAVVDNYAEPNANKSYPLSLESLAELLNSLDCF